MLEDQDAVEVGRGCFAVLDQPSPPELAATNNMMKKRSPPSYVLILSLLSQNSS